MRCWLPTSVQGLSAVPLISRTSSPLRTRSSCSVCVCPAWTTVAAALATGGKAISSQHGARTTAARRSFIRHLGLQARSGQRLRLDLAGLFVGSHQFVGLDTLLFN